jgi:hypothetical protein
MGTILTRTHEMHGDESDWHRCDFRDYQSGTLRLRSRAPFGHVLGYNMRGTLANDGPTGDPRLVECKSQELASLQTQKGRACLQDAVRKDFNITFLGNGYLKISFHAAQIFKRAQGLCVFCGTEERQRFVEKKEWRENGSWVYQGSYQGKPNRDGIYR